MKRAKSNRPKDCPYVGKGGLKLEFALTHFEIDVQDLTTADFGCNVGGFTDCLLTHGAAKVYAIDTGYGTLAWKLRTDERVDVCERTNILHWELPEPVDFIASDLGWTKQERSLPIIARSLKPRGKALTLVKPQYEMPREKLIKGVLPKEHLTEVIEAVRSSCPYELKIEGDAVSPYLGSGGNTEIWLLVSKNS